MNRMCHSLGERTSIRHRSFAFEIHRVLRQSEWLYEERRESASWCAGQSDNDFRDALGRDGSSYGARSRGASWCAEYSAEPELKLPKD